MTMVEQMDVLALKLSGSWTGSEVPACLYHVTREPSMDSKPESKIVSRHMSSIATMHLSVRFPDRYRY
jgi:hypothetical protein